MGMEDLQLVKNRENNKERQEAPAFEYKRVKLYCVPVEEEEQTTFGTVKLNFEMFN